MAKCPTCKDQTLRHTLLAEGLTALGCGKCAGALLALVTYRRWQEHVHGDHGSSATPIDTVPGDSDDIVQCPKCLGLMTKFRISSEIENRIDFCAHCEEIWLDKGEWSLIEPFARSGHLFSIVTRPWQRRLREHHRDEIETERLKQVLGDDYERFIEVRAWLEHHPDKDFILAQLHRRDHSPA